MAGRKKGSPLEQEIFQRWEEISSRDFREYGYVRAVETLEGLVERQRTRTPEWLEILALAHDGHEWKVGSFCAEVVTSSLSFNLMSRQEYDEAEEIVLSLMKHPGPFSRDQKAKLPVRLHVTRFVRDRKPEDAKALENLIGCGIYRPGWMASTIHHIFTMGFNPSSKSEVAVSDEARSLARAMAVAKRNSKRFVRASEEIATWE
jgi:hypothetical protein